jgi:uncharacterized membrane protein YheB (UPF0754 family)
MEWIELLKENYAILLIPFISAIIGWGTNVLAIKMTFYPLEFIGFQFGVKPIGWSGFPPIGWQGIVPSKAGVMAGKATDMITTKLIDIEEQTVWSYQSEDRSQRDGWICFTVSTPSN